MFNIRLRSNYQMYSVFIQTGPDLKFNMKCGIVDINEAHREVDKLYEMRKANNQPGIVVLENSTNGYRIRTERIDPRDTAISDDVKMDLEEFNRIFGGH